MAFQSMSSRRVGWVLGPVLLVGAASAASAQLEISRFTVDGGGITRATGGTYAASGTVGQPDAGRSSGGGFVLIGGFWLGGGAVSGVEDGGPEGGIDAPGQSVPLVFQLLPSSPNPVQEEMTLAFDLPEPTFVRAELYDASGRLVRTLAEDLFPAGRNQSAWNRRDGEGQRVPAGIYFVRFDAGLQRRHQKVVVIF